MIPLIVLAAGRSSRLGYPKGLVQKDGEFWLQRQFRLFKESGGTEAFLVLGFDRDQYFDKFPALNSELPVISGIEITTVVNTEPERGQFSSIQCAFERTQNYNAIFLLPIDVPAPSAKVWTSLLERHEENETLVTIPVFQKRGGHPIIVSQTLMKSIVTSKDSNMRLDHLIRQLPVQKILYVDCNDPTVTQNLNEPHDWSEFS